METTEKNEIRDNKLFKNIDFDSLVFQEITANRCLLSHGELLYRSGEISNSIFLVVRGEINLITSQFSSKNTSIIFSANDFFGVSEFIYRLPRGESAIALRDTYLIELTENDINRLIEQNNDLLANIYSASNSLKLLYTDTAHPIIDSPLHKDNRIEKNELPADIEPSTTIENEAIKDEKINTDSDEASTEMTFEQLEKINKAAHVVNSNVKIDSVLKNIVDVSVSLCTADRGTLYLVDKNNNELWSKVLQGNEPRKITLKMGDGFAGWAAEKKEVVNIVDASLDERFNDAYDKASGYKTKSVLCFPIKNKNGSVLGVIQLLNSKKDMFSKLDENFLNALSTHAAMALQNADLVEQLLKTERISSLGKMANFLIEDIKKPILVSKRYTEHLLKKKLSNDVENVVNMLLEQLNSIADIVQATSNFSHGEAVLKSCDVNLNEVLSDFVERANSFAQSMNCKIITKFDSNVQVNMDTKEFYQGFKHIIKNACEAMPDGGEISVSTSVDGEKIKIEIKDSGIGIPANFSEKIFEPFMSFGKKTGTGLGLSVTRKIVEEHGGTIIASSDGLGSAFTIYLPIVN